MFEALDISSSGLQAQRTRLDTISENIANVNTTKDRNGNVNPYRRKFAVFATGQAGDKSKPGIHVEQVATDQGKLREVFDPSNPEADAAGIVHYPNVELAVEYVNAMECTRAYEANITAMEVTKSMINAALRLIA